MSSIPFEQRTTAKQPCLEVSRMKSDQVKPCPFCARRPLVVSGDGAEKLVVCENRFCPLCFVNVLWSVWQTRPVEQVLEAEIRKGRYEDGLKEGYAAGYEQGYDDGYDAS